MRKTALDKALSDFVHQYEYYRPECTTEDTFFLPGAIIHWGEEPLGWSYVLKDYLGRYAGEGFLGGMEDLRRVIDHVSMIKDRRGGYDLGV